MEIFDLNGAPVEKLCRAISFTYDKVNSRIAVTALFPEPICLKAVISFQNQRLPNGDFDIIVLSSELNIHVSFRSLITGDFFFQVAIQPLFIKTLHPANIISVMKPNS